MGGSIVLLGLRCYRWRVAAASGAGRVARVVTAALWAAVGRLATARRLRLPELAAAGAAARFRLAFVLVDRAGERLPADATDVDIRFACWLGLPRLTGLEGEV